jgi:hypothetical protein
MTDLGALDRPPGARARLDVFGQALERIHTDDLPLYAARLRQPDHRRAVEAAAVAARERGLENAVDAARHALIDYMSRQYAASQLRVTYVGMNTLTGLGSAEDQVRITRSLADAATALVLWDELDEADRSELLGLWARLLP